MLENNEFKSILDNIATSVGVAEPVYDETHKIIDFTIRYVNSRFAELTKNLIREDMKFSSFKDMLSKDVSWEKMATETVNNPGNTNEKTFYSILYNCWLRVRMNSIQGTYIAITLTDISLDKTNEQRLRRQNLRLASLTDELNLSRAALKNKLESIQVLYEQLQIAAYHDALTNLNNRAQFDRSLSQAITNANLTKKKIGLIFLDIDNMKIINDSKGHIAGDEVIRKLAVTLRQITDENSTAYRFSGDDFIVMMENISDRQSIIDLADRLLEACNEKNIYISGGITVYPDDTTNSDDLLKFADMAKSEVKKNGKNNFFVFHQIMQEKFVTKMNIENKMSKAMADKVFQLYFQPQFDVSTNKLRGFEALLRWHDEDLGWISPEQFIPLAEETNLVIPLGDWVMDTGIEIIARWEKEFNFDSIVSINVSPVQFNKADFMEKLIARINKYNINPRHLEIEITEGILIDKVDETVQKLNTIRAMGIGVSLDDFGTGYSSLRYLQLLPLTTLKIDKSFISNINSTDGVEANITESIVSLVSRMGLDTIAEGVETKDQLEALKKINCHNIQGFLKGKPMPVEICDKILSGDESAIITIENDR